MGNPDDERRALASVGLEPPEDVSSLTDEQKAEIIARKKLAAERETLVFPDKVHEVYNADPLQLSKEDLLRRMAKEEEETESAKAAYHRRMVRQRSRREERWDSKVPGVFKNAKIENLPSDLRSTAREYIAMDKHTNIIMIGATGVGKTFLGYAIARELYVEGAKVLVKDAGVLINELKPGNPDKDRLFEQAKNVDYFMLDDLGAERSTDFADERLHLIIDHRGQWELPIFVTTNIALKSFPEEFGPRVASRLMHEAYVILVGGDDRRLG